MIYDLCQLVYVNSRGFQPDDSSMIQIQGVDVDGTLLRELRRGACFGERALLFSEPRSAKALNGGKLKRHPVGLWKFLFENL